MIRIQRFGWAPLLIAFAISSAAMPAVAQFETRGSFVALSTSSPRSIAIGDFNHDGKLDLAVVSYCCPGGGVAILLGNGDGTFQRAVNYPAGRQPFSIVAADFNHDGNLDLAVANSLSADLSILLGNGDGTFRAGPQNPPVPAPENFVTVGDFNGDGKLDLVALSFNNPCKCISVLLGNGDGTFQNEINTEPPFAVESIGVGDLNQDGKLDLATAGNFSVNILLGNGDGTFQYGASYPGEQSPASIAVADFSGDHKLDLAIANSEAGSVSVLLGNGDGTFQTAVDYLISFPGWVTAADVNGDHKLDLVVANSIITSSELTVLLGNGDGTFQPGTSYPAGNEAAYVSVGDFNGDGKKDLVAADSRYNDVIVLLNTGVAAFSPTTPLNFKTQAVGTTSAPQKVTLTNTGKTALTISSMKATGQFHMTSTCGASVAPGANCTISVTFSPKTRGAKSGTVAINDNASSKPQVIELSGTGT
jgi:Abnormal spindle-like microcephaly-assoc'd, ASPM-SPD-2-Hydin/FG-GAP-like repeat